MLDRVGQRLLRDAQHRQHRVVIDVDFLGQRARVPLQFHAGCPQPRLHAEAHVAERGQQVGVVGRERVDREPHVVDGLAQDLRHLLVGHRAALDQHQRGQQLRAEPVVHILHDALALLCACLDTLALTQSVEVALQQLLALMDAGLELAVGLLDLGQRAHEAIDQRGAERDDQQWGRNVQQCWAGERQHSDADEKVVDGRRQRDHQRADDEAQQQRVLGQRAARQRQHAERERAQHDALPERAHRQVEAVARKQIKQRAHCGQHPDADLGAAALASTLPPHRDRRQRGEGRGAEVEAPAAQRVRPGREHLEGRVEQRQRPEGRDQRQQA